VLNILKQKIKGQGQKVNCCSSLVWAIWASSAAEPKIRTKLHEKFEFSTHCPSMRSVGDTTVTQSTLEDLTNQSPAC